MSVHVTISPISRYLFKLFFFLRQSHYVALADLEFIKIYLPLCWD